MLTDRIIAALFAAALAFFPPLAFAQSSPLPGFTPGVFQSRAALDASSSGCAASQALDGSNEGNVAASASVPVTLTTSNNCGVIVVGIISNGTVSTVTAPGLTFTQRGTITSGSNKVYTYTAPYSSNFSNTITVATGTSVFTTAIVWGISGAPSSNYFDPNVPSAITGTTSLSITTTHSNDFIFSADGNTTAGADSGYTLIQSASNFLRVQYQISAAGTYADTNPGSVGIFDAIQ